MSLTTVVSCYYDDGPIKYAHDVQNGHFDRKHDYDHAVRLKEAYTAHEACFLPTPQRKF
jgi:hypothetical protein